MRHILTSVREEKKRGEENNAKNIRVHGLCQLAVSRPQMETLEEKRNTCRKEVFESSLRSSRIHEPFSEWSDIDDAVFKDLILAMTNLDPTKRITSRQALEHPWFAGSEISWT